MEDSDECSIAVRGLSIDQVFSKRGAWALEKLGVYERDLRFIWAWA